MSIIWTFRKIASLIQSVSFKSLCFYTYTKTIVTAVLSWQTWCTWLCIVHNNTWNLSSLLHSLFLFWQPFKCNLTQLCKSNTHLCKPEHTIGAHNWNCCFPRRSRCWATNAVKQDLPATRLIPRFCEQKHKNKQLSFAPSLTKLAGGTFILESLCLKTNFAPDL